MVYRLDPTAAAKLRELLFSSARQVRAPIESQERLINDLYTGRDYNRGYALSNGSFANLLATYPNRVVDGSWEPPEMGINLLLSRLQQILSALVPSKPTFHVKPRIARAVHEADAQNKISQFATDHGRLRDAVKRAAFQGMMAPYFCVKLDVNKAPRGDWEAFKYSALEARDCGYEPRRRRFAWHTQVVQFGDLSPELQAAVKDPKPQDWDLVRYTEVYHEGFRHGHKDAKDPKTCPVSYYLAPQPTEEDFLQAETIEEPGLRDFGHYVYTENVPACPLVFGQFNEPAPGEDVPPAEVVSWLPHIRKIVQDLHQIHREVRSLNTIHLIRKGSVPEGLLDELTNRGIPSEILYVEVDVDDSENGVNATWRPVEQSDNLASLLTVLQTDLQVFDDMIGLSPMERGIAQNPRKSATEAQSITAAASRRTRERLEVIARALADLLQVQFFYQRSVYGKSIEIPGSGGLEVRLDVPDPTQAQFAFEVDPVELGHLSKQGDAEALFNSLTVVSNTLAMFQGALPKPVRELLRQVLTAQGTPDADALIDRPVLDSTPNDRFMELLLNGTPIPVSEGDDHQAFVAYYTAQMGKTRLSPASAELERAIAQHNVYIRRQASQRINAQAQQNPVPGTTELGTDNIIQAAIDAGEPPPFPQSQGVI